MRQRWGNFSSLDNLLCTALKPANPGLARPVPDLRQPCLPHLRQRVRFFVIQTVRPFPASPGNPDQSEPYGPRPLVPPILAQIFL